LNNIGDESRRNVLLDEENDENTGLVVINQSSIYGGSDDIIEYARNPPNQQSQMVEVHKHEMLSAERKHAMYLQQLKANYEHELEK
jgi:hypothetical protein